MNLDASQDEAVRPEKKTKPGRQKETTWSYTLRSIEDYQRDYFNLKDRQKANAQRGRLIDRLTREKMQTVIFKIV